MPEERKLASMVFADIVDSTALGTSEDPELTRRTLAHVFRLMREVLTSYGGTVEKFVGDAVMAVFGVPLAHDDDAERAVRAAFALRERVALLTPSLPFQVALRIGINSGQVVADTEGAADTLVTGPAVVSAARLQQSAAPNEIVVGTLTHSLTTETVRFGAARIVDAKGLGLIEAFPALRLVTALPHQQRGVGRLRAPLIGRDAELRLLREAYTKASDENAASIVTIYGQAGVGKSRLVAELVELIGRERVLRGRCLPYGTGITYWPLQEMLRSDAGIAADDSRDEASRKLRAAVLAAAGAASEDAETIARRLHVVAGLESAHDAMAGTDAAELGQELRWGVRRYLEQRAASAPLVLVFDDIHWAEDPMLSMIEHLAEWSRAPLFVLCLARPDLRDRRPNWGGGLMNASAVRLDSLTAEETRRLIGALLTIDDLPASLREAIIERAQGNPLYVEEMLRMLVGAGHIIEHDGRWVATGGIAEVTVPATLQGLLAARLDQLPAVVKRTLQRASVIGKVFYPDALVALGGGTDPPVDELLTTAARRDFVVERDERGPGGARAWQFKHILIRDVAYESLPKQERTRLHDAIGRWLETVSGERRGEYAEIIAYHAHEAYRLARELRGADAAALGQRALDLLLAAARRARRAGERDAGLALFSGARDVADETSAPLHIRVEAMAFAALAREEVHGFSAAREDLDAALRLARTAGPSEGLVQLLMLQARESGESISQAQALGAEAVANARALGDHDLVVDAMLSDTWWPWFAGEIKRRRAMLAETRAYAMANGARRHLETLANHEARVAEALGDFAAFDKAMLERTEIARVHESKIIRALTPVLSRYTIAKLRGEYEAARQAASEHVDLVPELGLPGHGAYRRLGETLLALGQHDEAIRLLEEGLRRTESREVSAFVGESRQILARAYLGAGRVAEAKTSAELAYQEIADEDAFSRSTTAVTLAMVRAAQGDKAEADRLFRLAVDAAKEYLNLAVEARLSYARFLIDHERLVDARAQLAIAHEFFDHPFVAKRFAEVERLLRRCDEVRA